MPNENDEERTKNNDDSGIEKDLEAGEEVTASSPRGSDIDNISQDDHNDPKDPNASPVKHVHIVDDNDNKNDTKNDTENDDDNANNNDVKSLRRVEFWPSLKNVKGSNEGGGGVGAAPPHPSTVSTRALVGVQPAFDDDFLHRVVADAGRWAYGTVLVEVWVLNAAKTHLVRPENGWWMDPAYHASAGAECNLCRLTDASRPDFLEPAPLAPGVGLPGALWSEAEQGNAADKLRNQHNNASRRGSMMSMRASKSTSGFGDVTTSQNNNVKWREVQPLADDPDQPYNPRLNFLAEIGLGWAAGVPFCMGTEQGLVIYMARKTTDYQKLTSPTNEAYLAHATLVIGSSYSLRGPRRKAEEERKLELEATRERLKNNLKNAIRLGIGLQRMSQSKQDLNGDGKNGQKPNEVPVEKPSTAQQQSNNNAPTDPFGIKFITHKVQLVSTKFFGADVIPPPPFLWDQVFVTFFGSLISLLIITRINKALVENVGSDYSIVLGPFGALMTLQYGLTAAPASQPRNAVVGQAVALCIATAIGKSELDLWLRQSIGTSLAIGIMVKLGITHPPAGAGALLFSSGNFTWPQVAIMLMANVLAIVLAATLNNLSEKRQYPTFWGFRYFRSFFIDEHKEKEEKKKL